MIEHIHLRAKMWNHPLELPSNNSVEEKHFTHQNPRIDTHCTFSAPHHGFELNKYISCTTHIVSIVTSEVTVAEPVLFHIYLLKDL